MNRHVEITALAVLAAAFAPGRAGAAETYHTCTGFIDSVPTTLVTQGVWCLRQNLSTAITSGAAITVGTNNVTIDCNGFKLGGLAAGSASQTVGILSEERSNTSVRNCNVRGFHTGTRIWNGAGHVVEDSLFDSNLQYGIYMYAYPADGNGTVRRNQVLDTGGADGAPYSYGILAAGDVVDNTVSGVFTTVATGSANGIYGGGLVQGNVVRRLFEQEQFARGITTFHEDTIISRNRLVGVTGTNSIGIYATGENTYCTDNIAVNFSTAYVSCDQVRDNL